jgi:hypothetical protein
VYKKKKSTTPYPASKVPSTKNPFLLFRRRFSPCALAFALRNVDIPRRRTGKNRSADGAFCLGDDAGLLSLVSKQIAKC